MKEAAHGWTELHSALKAALQSGPEPRPEPALEIRLAKPWRGSSSG